MLSGQYMLHVLACPGMVKVVKDPTQAHRHHMTDKRALSLPAARHTTAPQHVMCVCFCGLLYNSQSTPYCALYKLDLRCNAEWYVKFRQPLPLLHCWPESAQAACATVYPTY